jgi:23S rRNA pseudouridine1911/1915/1917 synthase
VAVYSIIILKMAKEQYQIVFEDEYLIIANKAAGLLTIPDRYRPDLPSLYKHLQEAYGEIYIVHRLDKGTSGLICFAKDKETHRALNKQFEAREPIKKYYALVKGTPFHEEGTIEVGLSANTNGSTRVDIKRGKPSTTHYKMKEKFGTFSLLDVHILTGRTHQIRVHLQHIGHPLAVDELYTKKAAFYLSEIKRRKFNLKKETEETPLLARVPLHAYSLSLIHPVTKEPVLAEAEPPKDMRAALNQLRKWNK